MRNLTSIRILEVQSCGFFFLSVALLLALLLLPPKAHVQTKPKIDLNGTWKDGKKLVKITHIGSSVVAKFVQVQKCDPRNGQPKEDFETDFVGTVTGLIIDGNTTVCNWGESWKGNAGVKTVKMMLRISSDQNTLVGRYDSYEGPKDMTLTRECVPDEGEMCESVGRAIRAMKRDLSNPSAALYAALKQDVGVELSKIKSNLCDKPDKAAEVDALLQELDSMKFQPGKNEPNDIILSRIDARVKQYGVDLCGRSSTEIPPPLSCPQGSQAKTDDDTKLFNSFRKAFEEAWVVANIFKQRRTIRCLGEMLGQGCAPDDFIKNLQGAAMVRNEGLPFMEICKKTCEGLRTWYTAAACSKGGLTQAEVFERCKATCFSTDFAEPN